MYIKSIVLDCADNWGDPTYQGIRSIEFYKDGTLVELTADDITVYGANYSTYYTHYIYVTGLSKTGVGTDVAWRAYDGTVRVSCVFTELLDFDQVIVNNYHYNGQDADVGVENIVITTSLSEITSTTYNQAIADGWTLFDGVLPIHADVDAAQDYDLPLQSFSELPTISAEGNIDYNPYFDVDLPTLSSEGEITFNPYVDAALPAITLFTPEYVSGDGEADLPTLGCVASSGYTSHLFGYLSNFNIEGSFGERAVGDAKFPALSIAAYAGARVSEKLPVPTLDATCLPGYTGSLDKDLPFIQLECRMAHRADELKLPPFEVEGEISTPVLCKLNKKLPELKLTAAITGVSMTLSQDLSFIGIVATGHVDGVGTLDKTLPGILVAADGYSGSMSTLDSNLPDLRIEAASRSAVLTLDAYLPPVTTGVASGGNYGSVDNVMAETGRFSGELLRYERWA